MLPEKKHKWKCNSGKIEWDKMLLKIILMTNFSMKWGWKIEEEGFIKTNNRMTKLTREDILMLNRLKENSTNGLSMIKLLNTSIKSLESS